MLRQYFSLILFISPGLLYPQAQTDRYWLFGNNNYMLEFNAANGLITENLQAKLPLTGNEGNTSVIDPITGQVLFYTDGINVIDREFQIMPNGLGLNGHSSSSQSGLISPVPGSCSQYYVISNSCNYDNDPYNYASGTLTYSVVDLLLPGNSTTSFPLGDVINGQKDIPIHSNVAEAMILINDSTNSNHYWLITYHPSLHTFNVYALTSSAITLASTYMLPFAYKRPVTFAHHTSTGKLAVCSNISNEPVLILNFNSVNGNLGSVTTVPGTPFGTLTPWAGMYGLEWSPGGSKLYMTRLRVNATNGPGGQLYQYNMMTPLVAPLQIYQASSNPANVISGLKLMSDGKIYVLYINAQSNNAKLIAVIDQPEANGLACNFNPSVFMFSSDPGPVQQFPRFVPGSPIYIELENINQPVSCIKDSTYQVYPNHSVFIGNSSSVSYQLISAGVNGNATFIGNGPGLNYPYAAGNMGLDSVLIAVCDNRCLNICDTFSIVFSASPPPEIIYSISTCNTDSILLLSLPSGNQFDSWIWSTGDTAYNLYVNETGNYSQTVYTGNCPEVFHFYVNIYDPQEQVILPNVFSPNNDGINDSYHINGVSNDPFNLNIYNRWGQLVFSTTDASIHWDGKINSVPAPEGTYYAAITYAARCGQTSLVKKNYTISLFR